MKNKKVPTDNMGFFLRHLPNATQNIMIIVIYLNLTFQKL